MKSDAYLSNDRKYRYWLYREWDSTLPPLANFGVNPSTADENTDDATIRKDIGFSRQNGFGALLKLNVGAYRSTDPKKWMAASDPFGPENTPEYLQYYMAMFGCVQALAAWGRSIGKYSYRGEAIVHTIPCTWWCLGKNGDGTPRHTLMLPYTTKFEEYRI